LILGAAALVGSQILGLLGINLDVFGAVGGMIISWIGVQMVGGTGTGRTEHSKDEEEVPEQQDTLLIPLTLPLIIGPGAFATTIAISSQGDAGAGVLAALVGAGAVALAAFISYAWLGDALSKMRPATMTLASKIGGLLLFMIGAQMFLTGLKNFFA
jgi:multiple antibiotic resistance protein